MGSSEGAIARALCVGEGQQPQLKPRHVIAL